MTSRRVEIVVLAIGFAAIALLTVERERVRHAGAASSYSTYDSGPNGYRALYNVMLAAGVPLQRFGHPLALLDRSVGTLVLSTSAGDPSPQPLDRHDASALRRFIATGGHAVVLDDDFAGTGDVVPGVGVSQPGQSSGALAIARNRYTAGVRRVGAPIAAVFPFALRHGVPLLANAHGLVAVAYPYGRGEVVAMTAPELFGNAWLRNPDNAAFAYDLLAGHGPVAFDEYVHGYNDDLGFWEVMPGPVRAALWIVIAIAVLGLIGANVPFAPPVALPGTSDRDSSAYLDAMAALMRRVRGARVLVARFADDAARRMRGRDVPDARRALEELERLRALSRPSDAQLVRAAAIAYRTRREYGGSYG